MTAPTVERVGIAPDGPAGPEGGNSAWVLPDAGIVVDPGPPGDAAYDALVDGLGDHGLAVGDVEHVLVTHWHVDHAGLAPRLAAAADATLRMHERDAPLVGDYAAERERRVERDAATLDRWGVPDEHVEALRGADTPSPMPDETQVEPLVDGDAVGPLTARHTPGHTAGHVAFAVDSPWVDETGAEECVVVGDALLRTVTPNVGGGDTRQAQPLAAYRDTLGTLAAAGSQALPGHGREFALAGRIAELRAHHRERAAKVHDALATLDAERDRGVTPWAVARERFGEMDGYHVKFGAGEAYAHLADLDALGLADRVADDPLRYRLAADASRDVADPDEDRTGSVLDDAWLD